MEEGVTLEVIDFLNVMLRRVKLIILFTLSITVVTGIVSYLVIKPVYEAETSIIIGTAPGANNSLHDSNSTDILMYQNLMKTYSYIASSQPVINNAAEKLKNNPTDEIIKKNINTTFEENTQIMTIKYKSSNPKEARDTVNALADCFTEEAEKIYPAESINIIDKAQIPKYPVKSMKNIYLLMSFFLGLTVSIFIALLLDKMDNTIKTEKDMEDCLKIPGMGVIPKNLEMNMFREAKSPLWETYRIIKNNIQFNVNGKKNQIVAVTSPSAGEGKTAAAVNLAAAFAESGNSTVIIDFNLRNPKLNQIFEDSDTPGLSNFIIDEIDYKEIIKNTGIANLDVITSGSYPDNPSQILSSLKAKKLIEFLKGEYDFIIIDTPPVVMLGDTQIICQYCDGCVMLVSAGKTDKKAAALAKNLLIKVNSRIIGAVLSNF